MNTLINITDNINYYAPLVAFFFITLDVTSGIMKGAAQHKLSSKIMRQGFWHKASLLLVIILAATIDATIATGFNITGFNMPILEGSCAYIVVMEIVSILENITEINPELKGTKLLSLFGHHSIKEAHDDSKTE